MSKKFLAGPLGQLLIGPELCKSPVQCISQCLARKDGTNEFYTVKILTVQEPFAQTTDHIHGKQLMHSEYCLLKLLFGQKGIIQQYGIYKDVVYTKPELGGAGNQVTKAQSRFYLVLECIVPHQFCSKGESWLNAQQYLIQEKIVSECLAVKIFHNVVQIVDKLHMQNIVHGDLKLGNITLDKYTKEITLSNFGLAKKLISDDDYLLDQRGTPAYISPEIISGRPYLGKPSDMWALGVVLYTMLYGRCPFYASSLAELFIKIKVADYTIPLEYGISQPTIKLVKLLLVVDPVARLNSSATLERLEDIIRAEKATIASSDFQMVPAFNSLHGNDDRHEIQQPIQFSVVNSPAIEMILEELSNTTMGRPTKQDGDAEVMQVSLSPSNFQEKCPITLNPETEETTQEKFPKNGATTVADIISSRGSSIVEIPLKWVAARNGQTTTVSKNSNLLTLRVACRAIVASRRRLNQQISAGVVAAISDKSLKIGISASVSRKRLLP